MGEGNEIFYKVCLMSWQILAKMEVCRQEALEELGIGKHARGISYPFVIHPRAHQECRLEKLQLELGKKPA